MIATGRVEYIGGTFGGSLEGDGILDLLQLSSIRSP